MEMNNFLFYSLTHSWIIFNFLQGEYNDRLDKIDLNRRKIKTAVQRIKPAVRATGIEEKRSLSLLFSSSVLTGDNENIWKLLKMQQYILTGAYRLEAFNFTYMFETMLPIITKQ